MKHSLKISSLIIFAATIASTFTSCGNDSELFDEPVVHQTRAMTRASMGGEYYKFYQSGNECKTFMLIEGKVSATINLVWGPHNSAIPAVQSYILTPNYLDTTYYNLRYSNYTPVVDVNKKKVSVEYTISSVSQKVYNKKGELIQIIQHNLLGKINEPTIVQGTLKEMGEE